MTQPAFDLKGRVFPLTVMRLERGDPEAVRQELAARVRQAPAVLGGMPVVLDLGRIPDAADLAGLARAVRDEGLVPVGVQNATEAQAAAAAAAGLGVLTGDGAAQAPRKASAPPKTRVVTQAVRSGQRVYAQGGDLVVVGAVNPGAEVVADGHIHVYGALRGRALAGARGDLEARIYCHTLEAQLVSVAGHYRVLEDLKELDPGPTQIYLDGERLAIEPLAR
ncbi:MAG: septum site-determining protein MinC [Deferrisomatales bacterium]